MSRRHEETFFPRQDTDGQQTDEKMLNITYHQGNADQNYNEISPHTCQYGQSATQETTDVGEDVEKREPNVNWCNHCGKQCGGSSKTKIDLPHNLVNALLGI